MAGIKISNLLQINEVESGDFFPVARGGSETYKTPASQFVITGKNEGLGAGQFYFNEALVDGKRTMRFRTLSAVGDGISLTTVGNTVVINLTGTAPTVIKHISNGSQTDFSVSIPAPISTNPANYRVDIDGIVQEPITDYTVFGSNIHFTQAPPLSSKVVIVSNGIIRSYDITPTLNSITSGMYIDQSITTSKIADLAITTSKIALSSIGTAQLSAGAVANVHLLSGIDASKLTTGTLPADRIGLSAITTARINNGAVTAAKLDGAQIGSAPVYGIRAWVNFNGNAAENITGTYSRIGNIISIISNSHGYKVGHKVSLEFANSTPTKPADGVYAVTNVINDNQFQVTSGTTTGNSNPANVTIERRLMRVNTVNNVSSVMRRAQGEYIINFIEPFYDTNYAVLVNGNPFAGRVSNNVTPGTSGRSPATPALSAYCVEIQTYTSTPALDDFDQIHVAVIR